LPDGRVEIVAEGTAEDLERYLGALRAGGLGANISRVETTWAEGTGGFRIFSIRF
jgi:acylphosphatase